MTGTSLDGLDVALVKIEGTGLAMKATFLGLVSKSLGPLADQLRHFAEGRAAPPIDYLRAARTLGELHAAAVLELCAACSMNDKSPGMAIPGLLSFIVAHGQTIWHAPRKSGNEEPSLSWQLFDPWPLARKLKVPVCHDLRQADLIAGGQGAPITPLSDWIMYRRTQSDRVAIINLGGVANGTLLDADPQKIAGGDICVCNILIDGLVRVLHPQLPFDDGGKLARSGSINAACMDWIAAHPGLRRDTRQSLGREAFDPKWFTQIAQRTRMQIAESDRVDNDLLRSAVECVAQAIGDWVRRNRANRVVIAGGGTRNSFLAERIRHCCGLLADDVVLSDDLGIPSEAREAMAFAVLGALSQDGVPITLPQVTGAQSPGRAGAWVYP